MNPDLVHEARRRGEAVSFGDGSRSEILEQARIQDARVLVIAISDPTPRRKSFRWRALAQDLTIIVRTRYVAELDSLYRLGANEVIPEEFETSVEILPEYCSSLRAAKCDRPAGRSHSRDHYNTSWHTPSRPGLDELNRFLVGGDQRHVFDTRGSPAGGQILGGFGFARPQRGFPGRGDPDEKVFRQSATRIYRRAGR